MAPLRASGDAYKVPGSLGELAFCHHLEWYLNHSLIRMKLELVPCRMPWGEPAGDGRSGQGKGEGLSSHEGASPGHVHSSHGGISEHFSSLVEGQFSRSPLRPPHLLRSHWKNLIFCLTLPLSQLTSTVRLPHYFQVLKMSGKKKR